MWYLEQETKFPWGITIQPIGLEFQRHSFSTSAKTVNDVLSGCGFCIADKDNVIKNNENQLKLLQEICNDHNSKMNAASDLPDQDPVLSPSQVISDNAYNIAGGLWWHRRGLPPVLLLKEKL